MFNIEYLETLPHGEERLNYLKKCITEADNEKNIEQMIRVREKYINESVFYHDSFKAIIMFPEFMKLFDEYPGVISPSDFLFPFKWIIENSAEHYQVSLDQLEKYLDKFKEYCDKFGYTHRTYHLKRYQVYEDIDREKAREIHDEYLKYERTEISDCAACEASSEIRYQIAYGTLENAVAILNDMLDRNLRCAEVPHTSYAALTGAFCRRGMFDEAEYYADLFLPLAKGNEINFLYELSLVLILKTHTNISDALDLFCTCTGFFSIIKNPRLKFHFANAAYRLFDSAVRNDVEQISLRLPSDFELHNPEGAYNTAELRDFFYNTASDLAEKFDKRNGTDYYRQMLDFVYPEKCDVKMELPVHGAVSPEPFVAGILYRSDEDFPDPQYIVEEFEKRFGWNDVKLYSDDEAGALVFSSADKNDVHHYYRLYTSKKPDLSTLSCNQYVPQESFSELEEYEHMIVIVSDTSYHDRYYVSKATLEFADILNTGDSPVVLLLSSDLMFSSEWVRSVVKSQAPPLTGSTVRLRLYASAFEEGKADMVTVGLTSYGSRELAATCIPEDRIDFTASLLLKLAEESSLRVLRDEKSKMNAGIIYNEKSYVHYSWEALKFPDENGETDDNAVIFAEPLIHLTSESEGKRISELTDEDINNTYPRKDYKINEMNEIRCKNLYPDALEYFINNECEMTVGIDVKVVDEYGEDDTSYIFVNMLKTGDKGTVTSFGDYIEDISQGDVIDINPDDVYFFRIKTENDEYDADDLYVLRSMSDQAE